MKQFGQHANGPCPYQGLGGNIFILYWRVSISLTINETGSRIIFRADHIKSFLIAECECLDLSNSWDLFWDQPLNMYDNLYLKLDGVAAIQRIFWKINTNHLGNYDAVYRTALATQGLSSIWSKLNPYFWWVSALFNII